MASTGEILLTTSVSALTSVAITLLTFWVTTKWKKKQDMRDALEKEVADRLNRDLNVRRVGVGRTESEWLINPHWIVFFTDEMGHNEPAVREWIGWDLEEEVEDGSDGSGDILSHFESLRPKTVDRAARRGEWLRFHESNPFELTYTGTEPCSAEDRYLFRTLPKENRLPNPRSSYKELRAWKDRRKDSL